MNRLNALRTLQCRIYTAVSPQATNSLTGNPADRWTIFSGRAFASLRSIWLQIFRPQKKELNQHQDKSMHNEPPISCICMYTGSPKRLEEAIYSFLNQDYSGPKELVILNNNPDQTLIFKHREVKIINLPQRIKFRRRRWKTAVSACAHNLIFAWNADDISLPHRLSVSIKKTSRADDDFQFMPDTIFIWENERVNGPYQNLFHQGSFWSRQLFEQVKGFQKSKQNSIVFAPLLSTIEHPNYTELTLEEVFYIFRGLSKATSKQQQQSGKIKLKPSWQEDYSQLVQSHLMSGISASIDKSLPELSTFNRKKLLRYRKESGHRRYYVFEDRELAYISTSKVACTSIKTAMMAPYNFHNDVHNAWPHTYNGHLNDEHQDFFKFSFVRNPFDRLVSGYRNKIIGRQEQHKEYFSTIPKGISFTEFVTEVVKQPDCLINGHFQSQYPKLYRDGILLVDYLGRFENLAADWLFIAKRFDFDPQLPHMMKSAKNWKAFKKDFRDYYTEELVYLVYNRYRADVEVFGYQKEYEKLLAFVREKK